MDTAKSITTGFATYSVGAWVGYGRISSIGVIEKEYGIECNLYVKQIDSNLEEHWKTVFSNDIEINYLPEAAL